MENEPKYTVILRGQEFVLTKSQIEFDSPNYFTAYFLKDSKETQAQRLELFRSPDLFKLIIEYLCGYKIFPLNEKSIPSCMPLESGLQNLRVDAVFYQLDGLVKSCDKNIQSRGSSTSSDKSFMAIGHTTAYPIMSDTDLSRIILDRLHLVKTEMTPGNTWTTIVTAEKFDKMGQLQSPEQYVDFDDLQLVAGIESLARKGVGDYYQRGWKLIGWRFRPTAPRPEGSRGTEILIVLEDTRSRGE
ncbi:hypothetical protein B0J17DRAFT_619794 [Rhizoctonia solani]|nr:hypothetical protein B0J17DRAFT_619794 [Rhizoctonia solani]